MAKVAVNHEDEGWIIHAGGEGSGSDYDTLCGIDGDDPAAGTHGVTKAKGLINCTTCKQIWAACQKYKRKDFS